MKLTPIAIESISYRETPAFVSRESGCSLELIRLKVYPPSLRGKALRDLRVDLELGLIETARLLGVNAEQLSGLESGRYTLSAETEWTDAFDAMKDAAKGRQKQGTIPL